MTSSFWLANCTKDKTKTKTKTKKEDRKAKIKEYCCLGMMESVLFVDVEYDRIDTKKAIAPSLAAGSVWLMIIDRSSRDLYRLARKCARKAVFVFSDLGTVD
jgi:hypothetical protein